MRKLKYGSESKRFTSYTGESSPTGNFDLVVDFSKGSRGSVMIKNRPASSEWPKSTPRGPKKI